MATTDKRTEEEIKNEKEKCKPIEVIENEEVSNE